MNDPETKVRGQLEHNKTIALRFKKSQGTKEMPRVEKEVLAPNYARVRGGNLHLANNARDQDFPHPGMYLRTAIPDRVDVIEQVVAEGDRVGLLFRVTGTHTGNFFGIAPTGRKIDVYEIALLRIAGGQMVEGWFMMDETALLRQLGARLPRRRDGQFVPPPLPVGGEETDAMLKRLSSQPAVSQQDRNKITAVRSCSSSATEAGQAPDCHQRRFGFQHLREYGKANGLGELSLDTAFPDRKDRVEVLLAEGDQVWMRLSISGTHRGNLCGIPPNGQRMGISMVSIMSFTGGTWNSSWNFADELGLLLQLGSPDLVLA